MRTIRIYSLLMLNQKFSYMRKHLFFFLLCHGVSFQFMAQDRSIKSRVSDQDGGCLPGVNVILKGTTIGTITNLSGNYEVFVP